MNIKEFKSFNKKALVLATISVATLASCSKEEISQDISNNGPPKQEIASEGRSTGEYMVIMKDGSIAPDNILQENGIKNILLNENNTFSNLLNGFTAKLNKEQIAALKKDSRVAYIEEDKMLFPLAGEVAVTTVLNGQTTSWGVKKVGTGDGTGKTAWIIDSGIDPNHSDLNVDKARSKSFLSSAQGADYRSYADAYGHGTQIAGIIGAKNNSIGTVGVAANAKLVSLRVMDAKGGAYTSRIIRALNWVAAYGKPGDVVNYSIGGSISTTLDDAVKKVAAKGIYVAIASGNNAGDCTRNSPARVNATNVFTVSAMDQYGVFASFSNYGSPVDYTAPGKNLHTTAKGGGYATVGGTSMSAPHLAGVLLLTGGKPKASGYVSGDKDGKADPIASK